MGDRLTRFGTAQTRPDDKDLSSDVCPRCQTTESAIAERSGSLDALLPLYRQPHCLHEGRTCVTESHAATFPTTMSTIHTLSSLTSQTYTPSPPRSQPPSPIVSRKPLPAAPSPSSQHLHRGDAIRTSCPSCGYDVTTTQGRASEEAQRMISDLQAQVKLLNSKAAAAVDRLADYEDQLGALRAEQSQQQNGQVNGGGPFNMNSGDQQMLPPPLPSPQQQQQPQGRLSSLRALIGGGGNNNTNNATRRNPSAGSIDTSSLTAPWQHLRPPLHQTNSAPAPLPPSASTEPTLHSLQATLTTERTLRERAESTLNQTQLELEELTATLFGQANEMVAEERRARSKLEERVKILERREREKGERLKRLEGRVERVERVRGLVG
jgi:hypothetical protein